MAAPPRGALIVTLAEPTTDRPIGPRRGDRARGTRRSPGRAALWTIGLLLTWLLVGPRLDLPVANLRVEDLVFGVLAVLCLLHLRPGRPSGVTIAVAGVVASGLLSAVVASARGTVPLVTSVLYAVRPLEYWIVLPAVLLLLRAADGVWIRRMDVILAVVTVLQTAFAVLQYYFQIPVGFSHAAYTRAAGLTVGPYELGAIGAALVVYWVAHGRWVLASVAVIGLASSQSRVSVLGAAAALGVLGLVWVVRQARRVRREGWRAPFAVPRAARIRVATQVVAVAAAGLVLAFTFGVVKLPEAAAPVAPPAAEAPAEPETTTEPTVEPTEEVTEAPTQPAEAGPVAPPTDTIATRFAGTSVLGSWFIAGGLAEAVPQVRTGEEYQNIAYSHLNDYVNATNAAQLGAEPSNLVRFFRWHLILNTVDDTADVVLGLGPSFVGPSVDGSYLRFFADGGLLGVLAWVALIVMWLRRSPLWMRCVTMTYLVGGLFIDILYAQRPMVLFWLLLALAVVRHREAAAAGEPQAASLDRERAAVPAAR